MGKNENLWLKFPSTTIEDGSEKKIITCRPASNTKKIHDKQTHTGID